MEETVEETKARIYKNDLVLMPKQFFSRKIEKRDYYYIEMPIAHQYKSLSLSSDDPNGTATYIVNCQNDSQCLVFYQEKGKKKN